jgi:hypothetical protein
MASGCDMGGGMSQVWLIVAVLINTDGLVHAYNPTVQFDLDSCRREAQAITERWLAAHQIGVVTCRRADEG